MYKTDGIVLREMDYGETNKIVTLLTEELGKVSVIASGAKKPQSRLTAAAQPFVYAHWLLFGGKGMLRASQADVIDSFRPIREDLHKTAYTAYIMELTDRFVEEKEPSQGLFLLLLYMLRHMSEGKDPAILSHIFEMKMLRVAGIEPDVSHCSHCRKEISQASRFSIRMAGPLCESCHGADPQGISIKPSVYQLLRLFQYVDVRRIGTISVQEEGKRQLALLFRQYFDEYTGVTLKSRHFIEQMNRYQL